MDNVTNWWLGQMLLARRDQLSPMQGGTIPRQQGPNTLDKALPRSGGLAGLGELRDQSSGLRGLSEFRPPFMSSGFQSAQSPAPNDCFDEADSSSISTKGYDFCTRLGSFTAFPTDPKTGISRYRSEGSFTGRDPQGNIRTYPGGSTISVHPDGTVTVDLDM